MSWKTLVRAGDSLDEADGRLRALGACVGDAGQLARRLPGSLPPPRPATDTCR